MFQIHEDLNSYSRNKTDCRKTYIGVKRVYAERHDKGDKPGYKVIYEDGYESWSPKDVFEAAYFPIEEDNRLSPDDIDAFLNAGFIGVEKRGDKSTLVEVTFPTGWRDYEVSSCVDPANYDEVVGVCICREGGTVLTVTENGKGRRSDIDTYHITARGGKGIRNYDVSRDKVAAVKIVDDVDDVLLSSQEGIIIRLHANEIPLQSRYGSGVRVMRLGENDKVMVLARTDHDDEAQTEKIDASEADAEPTAEQLAEMEAADAAAATEAPEADPEEKE
jgi:hypothetical protein